MARLPTLLSAALLFALLPRPKTLLSSELPVSAAEGAAVPPAEPIIADNIAVCSLARSLLSCTRAASALLLLPALRAWVKLLRSAVMPLVLLEVPRAATGDSAEGVDATAVTAMLLLRVRIPHRVAGKEPGENTTKVLQGNSRPVTYA